MGYRASRMISEVERPNRLNYNSGLILAGLILVTLGLIVGGFLERREKWDWVESTMESMTSRHELEVEELEGRLNSCFPDEPLAIAEEP